MADGLDLLAAACWLRGVRLGADGSYGELCGGLAAYHGDRRGADRIVLRQAQTAALLGAGYEVAEVAVVVGCSVRTTRRDVELLHRVLLPGGSSQADTEPVVEEWAA